MEARIEQIKAKLGKKKGISGGQRKRLEGELGQTEAALAGIEKGEVITQRKSEKEEKAEKEDEVRVETKIQTKPENISITDRLLQERVFRKLKEKNPEQMEKLAKIFGGKDIKIKDMVLDIGKMEFASQEADDEENMDVINEWETSYGMMASEKKAISVYDKKLSPGRQFKNAKKAKSGIIQWLLGFELSKSKSFKR